MSDDFKVRDLRNGEWFWIHKKVLEIICDRIGPPGVAVYNWLARFSNSSNQTCYPSIKLLAQKSRISIRTCIRILKILETNSLIRKEKKEGKLNTYSLLKLTADGTGDTMATGEVVTPEPLVPVTPGKPNNNYNKELNKNNASHCETDVSRTNPQVKTFLKFWGDLWSKEVGRGKVYPCAFGKEGKIVKELLKIYSLEDIQTYTENFFRSDDEFVRHSGYTIGAFKFCLPRLIAKARGCDDKTFEEKFIAGETKPSWEKDRSVNHE